MSKNDILLLILFTIPFFTLIVTEIAAYLKTKNEKTDKTLTKAI